MSIIAEDIRGEVQTFEDWQVDGFWWSEPVAYLCGEDEYTGDYVEQPRRFWRLGPYKSEAEARKAGWAVLYEQIGSID